MSDFEPVEDTPEMRETDEWVHPERADREQAEGAARYERAITGGMSREQRAELYRRLAADLPRERPGGPPGWVCEGRPHDELDEAARWTPPPPMGGRRSSCPPLSRDGGEQR